MTQSNSSLSSTPSSVQAGTLYVVATPIGHRADMSQRAISVLQDVDLIAAEDTRHSSRLMPHFGITTRMVALHEHNEVAQAAKLIEHLATQSIALISDAGTPLISDPGFKLVRAVIEAGFKVCPIPGACAAIAALCVSGLPTDQFYFAGFLPSKAGPRAQRCRGLAMLRSTIILYVSPHRLAAELKALIESLGEARPAMLARELTKQFETHYHGTLATLLQQVEQDRDATRGELVLVVQGADEQQREQEKIERFIAAAGDALSNKDLVAFASDYLHVSKNAVKQRLK